MADERRRNERESEQTCFLRWEEVFSAVVDLMEDCERQWDSTNVAVGENIQIRLEYLILAFQQELPIVSVNGAALNEILRIYAFCMDNGYDTTHRTVQTLQFILSTPQKSCDLTTWAGQGIRYRKKCFSISDRLVSHGQKLPKCSLFHGGH